MLKRLYIYSGAILGIGLGLYLTLLQTTQAVSQRSTVLVKGHVHADDASPLRGVWVSLIRISESGITDSDLVVSLGGAAVVRAQTGPDGGFAVELPVGRYDVRASENGFQTYSNGEPFEVRPGSPPLDLNVTMVPTASLSGRVAGLEGSEISGIVVVSPSQDPELPPKQRRVVNGQFSVVGLDPGSYTLEVRIPGYVPVTLEDISLIAGDRIGDLVVSPVVGRRVQGEVRDSAGREMAGAEVMVSLIGDARGLSQVGYADENGVFSVSGLTDGIFEVSARARGYSGDVNRLDIDSEDLTGIQLQLDPLGRVIGSLAEDIPAATTIYAIPERAVDQQAPSRDWVEGDLSEDGAFEIVGLSEGAYYLAALAPGFLRTYLPGTFDPKEANTITILEGEITRTESFGLLTGSKLSGDALTRDSGAAIANATVELVALDRRESWLAVTGKDGRFELRGIGPGRYMVKVTSSGHISQFFPGVTQVEEATPLEVDGVRDEANISIALPIRAPADFNADGVVDVVDLDRFIDRIKAGGVSSSPVFDANLDGLITYEDFDSVVQETRLWGQMLDPPMLMNWRSTDAEPGEIRADLKVDGLEAAAGFLVRVHYDTEEAEFVEAEPGESIYKDGIIRVEEVGPGVLLLIGGTTDRSLRDGPGSLVSLVFDPKDEKGSVRIRTERAVVLQAGGQMAAPSLPDPVRLSLPPDSFYLLQNIPNPFNPETTIAYELPEAVQVKLAIFNLVGQRVRSLVDEFKTAGRYEARWDGQDDFGRDVGSGVYFYSLEAGTFSTTKRMLLIR